LRDDEYSEACYVVGPLEAGLVERGKMKRWKIKNKCWLLAILFLSACSAGSLTMGVPTHEEPSITVSTTPLSSRTLTAKSTPTQLPTLVAIPSPTEGPTPDLELLNLHLQYDGDGGGLLFGEIRNNTDTTIVFPGAPILRLTMDAWTWNGWGGYYRHHEFSVDKGSEGYWITGCFLYPGETGLIRATSPNCQNYPDNCISTSTFIETPPKATGIQLVGYQDLKTYIPWPDLYAGYHPQAENVVFALKDRRIEFSFELPKRLFNPWYDFTTWVVAYDAQGSMLGIISKMRSQKSAMDTGGVTYKIWGYYAPKPDQWDVRDEYFLLSNIQVEDINRIDHIKVMVEMRHKFLCNYNSYDSYREWMAEHPDALGG
jgi:hypothetical protein